MSYPGQPQSPWPGGESHQPCRPPGPADSDPWHGPSVVWGPARALPRPPGGGGSSFGVIVGVVLLVGAGAGAYLMTRDVRDQAATHPSLAASPAAPSPSVSVPNSDARTSVAGECLLNAGTSEKPDMQRTGCAGNTYEVLKRIDGTADESTCNGTAGLTDWYFFDHPDNAQDFVLCLHKR